MVSRGEAIFLAMTDGNCYPWSAAADVLTRHTDGIVRPMNGHSVPHAYNELRDGNAHMRNEHVDKSHNLAIFDLTTLLEEAACQDWPVHAGHFTHTSYRFAPGQETIELGNVEFRILLFLASRPYHAFTRQSIATAVSSQEDPVSEETVDRHIASLLDQLGMFHDYVQAVPYIGYRFKA
jgi:DNA-binding response OmpR family regulator